MSATNMTIGPKPDFLSSDDCRALFARMMALRTGGGGLDLAMVSQAIGSARWVRNRMHQAGNISQHQLDVARTVNGANARAWTNRIDDAGLREVIARAEWAMQYDRLRPRLLPDYVPNHAILHPALWSEPTATYGAEDRAATAREMMAPSEGAGAMAAGDLIVACQGHATLNSDGLVRYYPTTAVECSMTVRDVKKSASGWAGVTHYDVTKIDPAAIAARALDKCQRSANPVGVEPGRYTAILEPQAVSDLFSPVINRAMDRGEAESGNGPFKYAAQQSKIGQRVLDPRLNVYADPMDPDAGFVPFERYDGIPYRTVTWIERGVLKELSYDRQYAVRRLQEDQSLLNPYSYVLTPAPGVATLTVEEMIASTQRGLLVTRFSGVSVLSLETMMSTGYTRDGVWLVESGKITKAVKNFRFTDSPLFALNALLDVGKPERVYRPGKPTMVPPIRVRDFAFSGLADAV